MASFRRPPVDRAILKIISRFFPKRCRLLEAGSNTGHLSLVLSQWGYQMTLLDRLEEPIDEAKLNFSHWNLKAQFLVGDIMTLTGKWDGVWNSGVIQCYEQADRTKMIEKLCSLAPRVLLFFPVLGVSSPPSYFQKSVEPGIQGCVQYLVSDLPCLMANYCSTVIEGTIEREVTGATHPFIYLYGQRISE